MQNTQEPTRIDEKMPKAEKGKATVETSTETASPSPPHAPCTGTWR